MLPGFDQEQHPDGRFIEQHVFDTERTRRRKGSRVAAPVEQGNTQWATQQQRTVALVAVHTRAARDSAVRILRALGATDVLAANSLEDARRAATGRPGDYAIIEAHMPDGSGSSLARDLKLAGWRRIVVLANGEDQFTARGALNSNVTCYLQIPADDVARPMLPAQAGPDRAAMGTHTVGTTAHSVHSLSQREIEVLHLVSEGKSNKDVGAALDLSALTVKSHLARIAKKLGTGDRAEMVIIAMRAGVIQ